MKARLAILLERSMWTGVIMAVTIAGIDLRSADADVVTSDPPDKARQIWKPSPSTQRGAVRSKFVLPPQEAVQGPERKNSASAQPARAVVDPLTSPSRQGSREVGKGETYLAGHAGIGIGGRAIDVELTGGGLPSNTTATDLSLKSSLVYGAKIGHFFGSLPWLGVETEVFTAMPHIKQQPQTASQPGGGVISGVVSGQYFRVVTWAMNLVLRYPGERLQPYGAVGLGLFFARLKDAETGEVDSTTTPGLNTQLGLRYLLTKKVSLFGEWKYNYARLQFDETPSLFGTNFTYAAHMLVFGALYSF